MGWQTYAQTFLALVFVLGLIGLFILFLRRLGYGTAAPTIGQRHKRVRLVEVTQIDARRRLVLVRHDDREHLILLGATTEIVIDSRDALPEDPPETRDPRSGGFASMLGAAIRKGGVPASTATISATEPKREDPGDAKT